MSWRRGAALRRKQESLCAQIAVHNALKRAVRSWVRHSVTVWADLTQEIARLMQARRVGIIWSEWRKAAAQMEGSRAKDDLLERSLQAVSKAVLLGKKLHHWKVWLHHCHTIKIGERVKGFRRRRMLTQGFHAWARVMNIRSRGHEVKRMQDNITCRDRLRTWAAKVTQRPTCSLHLLQSFSSPLRYTYACSHYSL